MKLSTTTTAMSSHTSPTTSMADSLYIDDGALDPYRTVTEPSPVVGFAAAATTGDFTVAFRNAAKIPVSIIYQSNTMAPPPIGNPPTQGALAPSATTTVVFPTGWAGALIFGQTFNDQGSRFEASFDQPAGNPTPSYDVSYVNGFSAPIVCGCNGQVVTGCNLPLFSMNTCPNLSAGMLLNLNGVSLCVPQ